jgi:hypothetical protein
MLRPIIIHHINGLIDDQISALPAAQSARCYCLIDDQIISKLHSTLRRCYDPSVSSPRPQLN